MPLIVVLALVVVPIVELYVIIQVGQEIGAGWTILLLIADAVLGSWLIRREGRRAWLALREKVNAGGLPAKELADGALILIGGTLLLTPGFLSDIVGIFLILPLTRPLARRGLVSFAKRFFVVVGPGGPGLARPVPGHRTAPAVGTSLGARSSTSNPQPACGCLWRTAGGCGKPPRRRDTLSWGLTRSGWRQAGGSGR